MKRNMHSTWLVLAIGICVSAQVGMSAPQPGVMADVFTASSDGAGTVTYGQGSVTVSFDTVRTDMYAGTPDPTAVPVKELTAGVATEEPVFAGNYRTAGVEGLAFAISNSVPGKPRVTVILKCVDPIGRINLWNLTDVELTDDGNGERLNNVALHVAEGWKPNRYGANFERDIQNVIGVGFKVNQDQTPAQSVQLRNLRLLLANQVITPSALLRSRAAAYFGLESDAEITADHKKLDRDRDGISDYLELTELESDPDDANSALRVHAERTHNGGLKLSWPGVVGRTYTVFRTESPTGTFEPVPSKVGIYCDATGEMSVTMANDRGKYFYSVQQVW